MNRMLYRCLAAAVLSFCPLAGTVQALVPTEVVASTFGPGESYNGDLAYAIQYFAPFDGFPDGNRYEVAARFEPTLGNYKLTETHLSIFRRFNGGPLPQITIAAEDGPSGGPGAVLAAKTITGFVPIDVPFQIETAPPISVHWTTQNVLLQAGHKYWMYLSWPAATGQEVYWSDNSIGATGNVAARGQSYGGDPNVWPPSTFFGDTPAFSVIGSPVPEPATATLSLAGVALLRRLRRRSCATR